MEDIEAYQSAMADAELMWPKSKSNPTAQSMGLPCSVYQLSRSRCKWTLVTPWNELLESAVVWKDMRLFLEIELIKTEHGPATEDVVVLRQHQLDIFTFRASDLEAANLSFVWARTGEKSVPCMVLDVRSMVADAYTEAFSYVITFQCAGHSRLVLNMLKRSWCAQSLAADTSALLAQTGGQSSAARGVAPETMDVSDFFASMPDGFAENPTAGATGGSRAADFLDLVDISQPAPASPLGHARFYSEDFALDFECRWEDGLQWDEPP